MFALTKGWFCTAFSNAVARRVGEKTPFFFLQSFFFWGYFFKRKSVKGILLSIDSASNYSNYLSFIHFFFAKRGTKKKFPKRNAEQGLRRKPPKLIFIRFGEPLRGAAPLRVERSLLKKRRKTTGGFVLTPRQIPIYLSVVISLKIKQILLGNAGVSAEGSRIKILLKIFIEYAAHPHVNGEWIVSFKAKKERT